MCNALDFVVASCMVFYEPVVGVALHHGEEISRSLNLLAEGAFISGRRKLRESRRSGGSRRCAGPGETKCISPLRTDDASISHVSLGMDAGTCVHISQ